MSVTQNITLCSIRKAGDNQTPCTRSDRCTYAISSDDWTDSPFIISMRKEFLRFHNADRYGCDFSFFRKRKLGGRRQGFCRYTICVEDYRRPFFRIFWVEITNAYTKDTFLLQHAARLSLFHCMSGLKSSQYPSPFSSQIDHCMIGERNAHGHFEQNKKAWESPWPQVFLR
ncbi:hypothetical protein D3C73_744560 [compost metagenome]